MVRQFRTTRSNAGSKRKSRRGRNSLDPRAFADIEAIGTYHSQEAPGYAELLVRRLFRAAERLEAFPESGRVVPEIGDQGLREVVYRTFRIVYVYISEADRVEVLTVFHSSRDIGGLFSESA